MIRRLLIRLATGAGVVDSIQRANEDRDLARASANRMAKWHQKAVCERDEARDQVNRLQAEIETARKTTTLYRSLIGILRDVNRDLDERLVKHESGNDAPCRCTKSDISERRAAWSVEKVVDAADAQARLDGWQGHGSGRWGLGVAIDIEWIVWRIDQLEAMVSPGGDGCRR